MWAFYAAPTNNFLGLSKNKVTHSIQGLKVENIIFLLATKITW
jgi:hypothetical protein